MKRKVYSLMMLLSGVLVIGACGGSGDQQSEGTQTEQAAVINTTHAYICPMNCENSASNEPGKCIVCGMDLVKNPNYQGDAAMADTPAAATTDTSGQAVADDHAGHDHDGHEGHDH
jgi:hypothetical protein